LYTGERSLERFPNKVVTTVAGIDELMIVYLKEKMSPPSGQQFQETFDALKKQVENPNKIFSKAMEYTNIAKVQDIGWQPIARVGLRGVELFGFFCVGEMIGRRSIMGYKI
jgi:F-type H+-transporting ATPase subunit g